MLATANSAWVCWLSWLGCVVELVTPLKASEFYHLDELNGNELVFLLSFVFSNNTGDCLLIPKVNYRTVHSEKSFSWPPVCLLLAFEKVNCELLHLWGVLTFYLCFRSELATDVVLHRTVRLDSEVRSQNGQIYTTDGSSVWDVFGQRTIVRRIIHLCINTDKQTDHPSRRIIHESSWVKTNHHDNSSGRMMRLLARIGRFHTRGG